MLPIQVPRGPHFLASQRTWNGGGQAAIPPGTWTRGLHLLRQLPGPHSCPFSVEPLRSSPPAESPPFHLLPFPDTALPPLLMDLWSAQPPRQHPQEPSFGFRVLVGSLRASPERKPVCRLCRDRMHRGAPRGRGHMGRQDPLASVPTVGTDILLSPHSPPALCGLNKLVGRALGSLIPTQSS